MKSIRNVCMVVDDCVHCPDKINPKADKDFRRVRREGRIPKPFRSHQGCGKADGSKAQISQLISNAKKRFPVYRPAAAG